MGYNPGELSKERRTGRLGFWRKKNYDSYRFIHLDAEAGVNDAQRYAYVHTSDIYCEGWRKRPERGAKLEFNLQELSGRKNASETYLRARKVTGPNGTRLPKYD